MQVLDFVKKSAINTWNFNVEAVKTLTGRNQKSEEEKKNDIPISLVWHVTLFEILTFLTKYFPFSEFYKDRKFHHKNRYLTYLDKSLYGAALITGGAFEIFEYDENEYFVIFGIHLKRLKRKKKQNEKFLKYLKKKFGNYLYIEEFDGIKEENFKDKVKIIKLRKTFFLDYSNK